MARAEFEYIEYYLHTTHGSGGLSLSCEGGLAAPIMIQYDSAYFFVLFCFILLKNLVLMQLGGGQLVFSTSFCDYTYSREFEWHIDFSSCKCKQMMRSDRTMMSIKKGLLLSTVVFRYYWD